MTRKHTEVVVCPSCGTRQPFVVWDSINVTLNPELKESLLKGDLTSFHCEHCGHNANIEFDCLYHDQERSVMIWLKCVDAYGHVEVHPVAKQIASLLASTYTRRLVSSYHELLDKILVFDAGLSDVAIELFKLLVCMHEGIDFARPFLYVQSRSSSSHGKVLVFALETEKGFKRLEYSLGQFLRATERLLPKIIAAMTESATEWPHVDRRYVFDLLQSTGFARKMGW